MMRLRDKVAVLTGSAQGLGRVIAIVMAEQGAKVVLNDVDAAALENTLQEIRGLGHAAASVQADVTSAEQVELDFADTRGTQAIPLVRAPGPNIETTFVTVTIEEVYPGTTYDDTCLAEIEVWGITR